jgi:hypothetical protein
MLVDSPTLPGWIDTRETLRLRNRVGLSHRATGSGRVFSPDGSTPYVRPWRVREASMQAMVHRGHYRIRVEEKHIPAIEQLSRRLRRISGTSVV